MQHSLFGLHPKPIHDHARYYPSGFHAGKLKAVGVPHRVLDNVIEWTLATTSPRPLRTLQFAARRFDVFVQEVFTAWCSGGCMHLPADHERNDLGRILELLHRWRIERLFLPPAVLIDEPTWRWKNEGIPKPRREMRLLTWAFFAVDPMCHHSNPVSDHLLC